MPTYLHTPHTSTLTEKQQTREVKGLSKVPVRHGSYHPPPCASLSLPSQAGVASSVDIAATSGKTVDCIVTAERGRAQNHTTYYLTPKAVRQSWCRAGCWCLEMPPRGRRAGNMVRGPTWPARC